MTLVGPGGIGKTRLAVETALAAWGRSSRTAPCSSSSRPLRDPDLLLPAIGQRAGAARDRTAPRGRPGSAEHLRPLELLLVLDNLEHLVEGVAPLVALLGARSAAEGRGDQPDRAAALAAEQVVRGAAARAGGGRRAVRAAGRSRPAPPRPYIEASAEVRSSRSASALEGSPLAIELAAPWLRTLPPERAADAPARLAARDAAGRGARRAGPAQHAARHDRLELRPARRRRAAAVRRSSRSSRAASRSTRSGAVGGVNASVERLGTLVGASVVRPATSRYRLLEVVREYAAERLGENAGAAPAGTPRHFTGFAEAAEPELSGTDQAAWLSRLDAEHDNLRAALDWLAAGADAAAELRLPRPWRASGTSAATSSEGLARLRHAIERARRRATSRPWRRRCARRRRSR